MKNTLWISFVIVLFVYTCSEEKSEKQGIVDKITRHEQEISKILEKRAITKSEIKKTIQLYESFYKKYPNDSLSAKYLMKAGQAALSGKLYNKALLSFHKVEKQYHQTSYYPMSVFLQGFVYDENNDTTSAKSYYKKFIRKFPDHRLKKDAEISLKNIGKSPEELIKEFTAKEKGKK